MKNKKDLTIIGKILWKTGAIRNVFKEDARVRAVHPFGFLLMATMVFVIPVAAMFFYDENVFSLWRQFKKQMCIW